MQYALFIVHAHWASAVHGPSWSHGSFLELDLNPCLETRRYGTYGVTSLMFLLAVQYMSPTTTIVNRIEHTELYIMR